MLYKVDMILYHGTNAKTETSRNCFTYWHFKRAKIWTSKNCQQGNTIIHYSTWKRWCSWKY